jgi:rare lipoprotein A
MSSVGCAKRPYVANPDTSAGSVVRVRNVVRLLVVTVGAAALAACAQSGTGRHSDFASTDWRAPPPHARTTSFSPDKRVVSVRKHTPFARPHGVTTTQTASQGIASFYTEGQQTASGEKFNTHDLTAAHPTLPFGTRLRVTNVSTGQSVTVRINDRGPYVPGRVVDVSHAAANELGIVESGLAKVKLDVVH